MRKPLLFTFLYVVVCTIFAGCSTDDDENGIHSTVKIINGHKFIDLGLPSGLLWAETNIGAETAADDGEYFAWGETKSKSNYDWSTYKYGRPESNFLKYNGYDEKKVLDLEDDAAYIIWGTRCRIPTDAEFEELSESSNCTWTWTRKTNSSGNNIDGYEVTSVKNGNSIFFPASGYRSYKKLNSRYSYGSYWTSAIDPEGHVEYACHCGLSSNTCSPASSISRFYGYTIRPVAER